MAGLTVVQKDPQDIADYSLDWATFLGTATISTAAHTVEAGITKVQESSTATTTKVRLSGGTVGGQYTVTCQVDLSTGERFQRSFEVAVEER